MEETRIVLDTSIFVNPSARYCFGDTPYNCFNNFLTQLGTAKDIVCYIPPLVFDELIKFMEQTPPLDKTILLHKKGPSSYQTLLPALFIYELIEESRSRTNKGLRIAEKYARQALKGAEEDILVKRLRDEYRMAVREGVIDSKEDCDIILLAQEVKGAIATADNGLITWAQKLGIPCISAEELKVLLDRHS